MECPCSGHGDGAFIPLGEEIFVFCFFLGNPIYGHISHVFFRPFVQILQCQNLVVEMFLKANFRWESLRSTTNAITRRFAMQSRKEVPGSCRPEAGKMAAQIHKVLIFVL